jgi:hypothetical protein
MDVHRSSARVDGRASRFRNGGWSARRGRVNRVTIQRGLQEDRRPHHPRYTERVGISRLFRLPQRC